MSWNESRYVDSKQKTSSKYIMTYLGLNVKFEVCCVWLQGGFKWMLNSVSMGIHANFICKGGDVTIDQVKLKAFQMIKKILEDRLQEVTIEIDAFEDKRRLRA